MAKPTNNQEANYISLYKEMKNPWHKRRGKSTDICAWTKKYASRARRKALRHRLREEHE